MKLSNDELIKIITENADRLCVFYITEKGGHLESLDVSNSAVINGDSIQLNCETTKGL
jgi:hypothetical protein